MLLSDGLRVFETEQSIGRNTSRGRSIMMFNANQIKRLHKNFTTIQRFVRVLATRE